MWGARPIVVALVLAGCGAAAGEPEVAASRREGPPSTDGDLPGEAFREPPAAVDAPCDRYEGPTVIGTVSEPTLSEISGLAASRAHEGVLYVHNDSGEPHARFFAIRTDGEVLGEYALGGEPAFDLEEIAIGSGPRGHDAIYLADIGDNDARAGRTPRASIWVLRVEEPPLAPTRTVVTLAPVERFELRYPADPVDAEAFFVEPASGDLYVLGKVASGVAPLFVARAPLSAEHVVVLEALGEFYPTRDLGDAITASSLDASGARLAVRTYRDVLVFSRAPAQSWLEALRATPVRLPRLHEPQGEAITFLADGSIVSITEGAAAPVQRLTPTCGAAQR